MLPIYFVKLDALTNVFNLLNEFSIKRFPDKKYPNGHFLDNSD